MLWGELYYVPTSIKRYTELLHDYDSSVRDIKWSWEIEISIDERGSLNTDLFVNSYSCWIKAKKDTWP